MNKFLKVLVYTLADVACVIVAWIFSAIIAGFPFLENGAIIHMIIATALVLISNAILRVYFIIWQYAGTSSAIRLFGSCVV
jgi:FlaA1/EpsC-like NDP-sugar epimerase